MAEATIPWPPRQVATVFEAGDLAIFCPEAFQISPLGGPSANASWNLVWPWICRAEVLLDELARGRSFENAVKLGRGESWKNYLQKWKFCPSPGARDR
jgi:hypothetical protein